jgi:hypothetical protein
MKVRSLLTLGIILMSMYGTVVSGDTQSAAGGVVNPLDEYVSFLNEKVEKATGDVASKTARVEQLKKTVAELEKKQSVSTKIGTIGTLAKDDTIKDQIDAEYIDRKKELDGATAALEAAVDSLTLLRKQQAAQEYTKNKFIELEQIMAGAAQMNLDDAELAALTEDDDDAVSDSDVAAAATA